MILMISAQTSDIEGPAEDRFGRSEWLIQINTDTLQWEAHSNPGASQSGGAGVAAAQFVIDHHANVVISRDFGPHAAGALRAAGIEMRLMNWNGLSVRQVVDNFLQGKLPVFN